MPPASSTLVTLTAASEFPPKSDLWDSLGAGDGVVVFGADGVRVADLVHAAAAITGCRSAGFVTAEPGPGALADLQAFCVEQFGSVPVEVTTR